MKYIYKTGEAWYIQAMLAAGDSEFYNKVYELPGSKKQWECTGLSKTEQTVRFSRLVEAGNHKLRQVNKYVKPETMVRIVPDEEVTNDG